MHHSPRIRTALWTGLLLAGWAMSSASAHAETTSGCKDLAGMPLSDLVIDSARDNPAGTGPTLPGPSGVAPSPAPILPAHCEVTGHTEQRIGRDGRHYAIRFHLRRETQAVLDVRRFEVENGEEILVRRSRFCH